MSVTILAERWIFGRVEPAYSPGPTGGYQTLWFSRGLSKSNLKELETIASTFDTSQRVRLQFFRLSDGRFAFTQVRPSEDPEMVDRERRPAFVCFAWVLDTRSFSKIACHPFALFDSIVRLADVRELVAELGPVGTVLEQERLTCRPPCSASPDIPDHLRELLIMTAFQAARGNTPERPAVLLGGAAEAAVILSWTLSHLPPSVRGAATFSTQTDLCSIPNSRFLVVARTATHGQKSLLTLALSEGRLLKPPPEEFSHDDGRRYCRWLSQRAPEKEPPDLQELETINNFLLAMNGVRVGAFRNPERLRDLILLFGQELIDELTQRLAPPLQEELSRQVATSLLRSNEPPHTALIMKLLSGQTASLGRTGVSLICRATRSHLPRWSTWWLQLRLMAHQLRWGRR